MGQSARVSQQNIVPRFVATQRSTYITPGVVVPADWKA